MALVKNNQPRVVVLGQHATLAPGVNEVDDAEWKEAQKIPMVQKMLDGTLALDNGTPHLEHVAWGPSGEPGKPKPTGDSAEARSIIGQGPQGTSPGTPPPSAPPLSSMNAEEAKKVVADTYDKATLERWSGQESRVTVQAAIEKQLELIELTEDEKNPPKK